MRPTTRCVLASFTAVGVLAACSSSKAVSPVPTTLAVVPTVAAATTTVAPTTTTTTATTTTLATSGGSTTATPATTAAPTTATAAAPKPLQLGNVALKLTPVITLKEPIALGIKPNDADTLYVAERAGVIVAVTNGEVTATVLDMRNLTAPGGERGLLGFTYSPDGARLYTSYTDTDGNTAVDEYQVDGNGVADKGTRRTVLTQEQPFANHNGGNILFGPDGMLYLGLGDGGAGGDPQRNGENMGTLLGKLLRIDPNANGSAPYSVPADNPYVSTPGARPEIYSHGLRNPWRYSFDAANGDLWIGDVGQNAIEEVDHVAAADGSGKGADFGWSAFEGTAHYNADQSAPDHVPPVHEYKHGDLGCSITGGFVYRGAAIPALVGAYVYADYCVTGIRAIDPVSPATAVKIAEQPASVVSFGQGPTLELYALSFDNTVYRLDPA